MEQVNRLHYAFFKTPPAGKLGIAYGETRKCGGQRGRGQRGGRMGRCLGTRSQRHGPSWSVFFLTKYKGGKSLERTYAKRISMGFYDIRCQRTFSPLVSLSPLMSLSPLCPTKDRQKSCQFKCELPRVGVAGHLRNFTRCSKLGTRLVSPFNRPLTFFLVDDNVLLVFIMLARGPNLC